MKELPEERTDEMQAAVKRTAGWLRSHAIELRSGSLLSPRADAKGAEQMADELEAALGATSPAPTEEMLRQLISFTSHRPGCASKWRAATGSSQIGPCDCGLAAAIAGATSPARSSVSEPPPSELVCAWCQKPVSNESSVFVRVHWPLCEASSLPSLTKRRIGPLCSIHREHQEPCAMCERAGIRTVSESPVSPETEGKSNG